MEHIATKSLGIVDWVFFCLLLLVSLSIGIYSAVKGRGNNSTQEFLLGGRQMSPVPVAISLLGGVISAISILGLSTEMYFFGSQLTLNLVGFVVATGIVQHVILPILYPLKIISLNEYIVLRFKSVKFRKMATGVSLITSFIYMGMCLYAPSLTLSTVTSLPTWASITIMGVICTFYITIGGVKAVVYTDVVQTILMLTGVLVVVIVSCIDLGGVSTVFSSAYEGGRLQFFNMDPNPLVRHTFWSVQAQGFYGMVAWIGLNQSCYQRFASVATLQLSKRLCIFFIVGLHVLWLTFYFSGIVAYAVYRDCDPLTSGRIEKPDQILPYLVLDKLSHITGMAGLFVAAVYGGVLSSLSSTGNAVACVLWEDILKDLKYFRNLSDAGATKVIKLISASAGLIGIGLGIAAGKLGEIYQVSNSIGNAFSGSLIGIFITGICTPWTGKKGAYAGFFVSLAFNIWLVIGKFVKGLGSPKKLPLSVEGCPENLLLSNGTGVTLYPENSPMSISSIIGDDAFSVFNDTMVSSTTPFPTMEEEIEKDIYDLSYCYTGILGMIINLVVGSAVTFFTGPNHPKDVDRRLVSPFCYRMYEKLWKLTRKSDDFDPTIEDKIVDKNAVIPMITVKKISHIENQE